MSGNQDSGLTGAGKFVTSTLGNTVGGLSRTVGGVTGAATRGIGDTITSATGSAGKPLGNGLANIGTSVENGTKDVAKGVENAGEWKSGGTGKKFWGSWIGDICSTFNDDNVLYGDSLFQKQSWHSFDDYLVQIPEQRLF